MLRWRVAFAALLAVELLLALVPSLARAAALDVSDTAAPVFTTWGPQDGLSGEIWATVGNDSLGYAWAGSASSLARFDGYRWTLVPMPGGPSLVRDMQEDATGTLWALSESQGLMRYDGHAWSLVDAGVGFIHRFSKTSDGTLWIGYERGISRLAADGTWQRDPANDELPVSMVVGTARTETLFGGPRQWAGLRDGLWYRELPPGAPPGHWQRFNEPATTAMLFTDIVRTTERGREELWLLSYGSGLGRIDSDGLRMWRADAGELPTEAMYSAVATYARDGERTLWIASRAGLLRIVGDRVAVFDRRHGLPSDAIRNVKLQRTPEGIDVLWIATEGGIARAALTDSQWRTVSLLGARENGVFSVLVESDADGDERLWVGTAKRGVGLLQRGEWRYFRYSDGTLPAEGGLRGNWLLPGPDGKTWRLLGLTGNVLLRVGDDLRIAPVTTPWAPNDGDGPATAIVRTGAGGPEVWFGMMASGTWRWSGGDWTPYPLADNDAPWSVLGMVEQRDATDRSWLWAATNLGIARFDGTAWSLLPAALRAPDGGYRSVTLVPRGARIELWAGSNRHGIVRFDVTDPREPAPPVAPAPPAAPDPTVYSVLADSQGRLYVCTNNGVQLLAPRTNGGFDARVFRRRDGLVHDECNTNAQLIDAHDRYWAGTLGGLSVYDPAIRGDTTRTRPRPLVLTEVRVDDVVRDVGGDGVATLPAGTRELRVSWSLLASLREAESTYRSFLEGYDPAPTAWTGERVRSFPALAPGRYVLRIEARDYAGTNAAPRTLVIDVLPLWWQRTWVVAAAIGVALAIGWGLVLLYNRNLRRRQRLLQREVEQRTGELNAANARLTELSYLDPLTGVANRRRFNEAIESSLERAVARQLPIGVIVLDVDHFKAFNDSHGHLAGDAALRAVAQALASATRGQDLVARFGGEEFACLMLDADLETVRRIAERMRALVEALPPRTLGNDTQTITVSAGVVCRVPAAGEGAETLLRDADAALYRAKRDGRNCVRE